MPPCHHATTMSKEDPARATSSLIHFSCQPRQLKSKEATTLVTILVVTMIRILLPDLSENPDQQIKRFIKVLT
jgi:hypothetical protein